MIFVLVPHTDWPTGPGRLLLEFGPGNEITPKKGVYFVLNVFVLYFVLYLYFLAPATRDR
jgi:hypothetical protein